MATRRRRQGSGAPLPARVKSTCEHALFLSSFHLLHQILAASAAREEKSTTARAGKAATASLGGKAATATRQLADWHLGAGGDGSCR